MQTRFMVVDDDHVALDCLSLTLCRYFPAASIETFNHPAQALLRLSEESFDVVLTDFNMPGMSGIRLLQAARESGADASFIVMTGEASDHILTDGLRLGMFALLNKPFNRTALVPLVTQALECHRLRREMVALRRTLAESGIEGDVMRTVRAETDEQMRPLLPY